jgi:hypothetical protein
LQQALLVLVEKRHYAAGESIVALFHTVPRNLVMMPSPPAGGAAAPDRRGAGATPDDTAPSPRFACVHDVMTTRAPDTPKC